MDLPHHHDGMLSGQLRGSWEVWCEETDQQEAPSDPSSDCIAESVLRRAMALISGHEPEAASEASSGGEHLVDRRIDAELGKQAITMLSVAESRFPLLNAISRQGRVSASVRRKLDDFVKLFLWGFDRQLLILARAVIEASINDVLTVVGETPPRYLNEKIEWAWGWGIFREKITYLAADWIRDEANKLLHTASTSIDSTVAEGSADSAPSTRVDGPVILLLTMLVLNDLLLKRTR